MTPPAPPPVVAIDGPAASGKSSTAHAVAQALGALHLDTGALYRAVTLVAGQLPQPAGDTDILDAAERRGVHLRRVGDALVPMIDGQSAEPAIRGPEVTAGVSAISARPGIRAWVTRRLREAITELGRPVVLDGRDIGTVVVPAAPIKVFLTASAEVRARRRLSQGGGGASPDPRILAEEADRLEARDRLDAGREIAPLRPAPDAVHLDTSDLSFDDQVARIVALARAHPLFQRHPAV